MNTQLKSILLATDLSPRADRAFDRAVQLADATGAALELLHVVEAGPTPAADLQRELNLARIELQHHVDEAALPPSLTVTVDAVTGKDWEAIVDRARTCACDLIVMGATAGDRIGEIFRGSKAENVIRHGDRPVLVVKTRPTEPYRHVLVALDASMPSRRALDRALGLFSAAEFTLVHAVEMPLEVGGAVTAPEEDEAVIRDLVEAKMARLEKDGRPLPAHLTTVIELGLAIDLVPAQARLTGADLAVLGTHGRRGMERAFLGSVAATLLEILPCDVLAVR